MRTCDIDASTSPWCYTPERHKTEHHGHSRAVWFGPQAQELVRPWLRMKVDEYLFSPRRAREKRFEKLRAGRRTKVQPSQVSRRRRRPEKLPGERYTPNGVYLAVT